MESYLENWFSTLKGKKVMFLGWGKSNAGLVELAARAGADTELRDMRTEDRFDPDTISRLRNLGVKLVLGDSYLEGLSDADLIFRTPGIDWNKPEIQKAAADGVEFTSEIEKIFDLCRCRTIGVTGSDGKTTTTTLIAKMLEAAGKKVHLGGNIGTTLLQRIDSIEPEDIAVVELSSFQLISMKTSPDIAVVTNLSPNHLDHHRDLAEYYGAKTNILSHQKSSGIAVLFDDPTVREWMEPCVRGKLRFFGRNRCPDGAYFDGMRIISASGGKETEIILSSRMKLPGDHNRLNAAAAVAATQGIAEPEAQRSVLSSFAGVEHRIELVREIDGVRYYNDSIATTPSRTVAGLKSFDSKIILIAGGYDKNLEYGPLAPHILDHVKCLILIGATADKIEKAVTEEASRTGKTAPEIIRCGSLEEAVGTARGRASSGDVVMLSPASASFDMFRNFEERGEYFKELVNKL
ncbi:MAG: UDP-N-acetylmuramoyl-L-alanine--D-glutamate ligase [Oscillospiraceae bacterium]|jgi:UDP-N-acetylmuramoylalanine--D-glutamate ligase